MINKKMCLSAGLAALALAATPAKADNSTAPGAINLAMPAMEGPLGMNTNPAQFNAGPLGKIYVTGVASALGLLQNHPVPGDNKAHADLSNGQVFIQNASGPVQFYVQGGFYSIPALGTSYLRSTKETRDTFGYIPQAYLKYAPNNNLSVMAGKLPTLLGNEYTFTFENMDIERGLLWNQTNAVTRGIQGNYNNGPWNLSLSWNDGYYSGRYTWLTGLASYNIDSNDSVAFVAGGNLKHNDRNTLATPKDQDNGSLYDLIYTHTDGPWTFNPYLQYSYVPKVTTIGINHAAETYGLAFLTKYKFDDNFSLAGRAEYIGSKGSVVDGAPNLLYGQGSRALSLTITPTYQINMIFVRAEGSYVHATSIVNGDAFGVSGNDKSQGRLMVETGILF